MTLTNDLSERKSPSSMDQKKELSEGKMAASAFGVAHLECERMGDPIQKNICYLRKWR